MEKDRHYPLTEEQFQKVIEPIVIREGKKSGRPTKISHTFASFIALAPLKTYKLFC